MFVPECSKLGDCCAVGSASVALKVGTTCAALAALQIESCRQHFPLFNAMAQVALIRKPQLLCPAALLHKSMTRDQKLQPHKFQTMGVYVVMGSDDVLPLWSGRFC
eukprot:706009-Amphidinium_carterae.1